MAKGESGKWDGQMWFWWIIALWFLYTLFTMGGWRPTPSPSGRMADSGSRHRAQGQSTEMSVPG